MKMRESISGKKHRGTHGRMTFFWNFEAHMADAVTLAGASQSEVVVPP